jgi:hypothetical protein
VTTEPSKPAQHVIIAPESGSRLEQLAEAYAAAKPAADEAKTRLETITDAIKLELTMAAPGATKIDLNASALDVPLRLAARTAWRLDSVRLKAEAPELYVRYAKQSSYWELRSITRRSQ